VTDGYLRLTAFVAIWMVGLALLLWFAVPHLFRPERGP